MKNRPYPIIVFGLAMILGTSSGDAQEKTTQPRIRIRIKKKSPAKSKSGLRVQFNEPAGTKLKTPRPGTRRLTLKSNASSVLPRLRRSPSGKLDGTALNKKLASPQSKSVKKPTATLKNKRMAGRFEAPKTLGQTATQKRPGASPAKKPTAMLKTKRMAGRFQPPKTIASTARSARPSTARSPLAKNGSTKTKPKSKFKMGKTAGKALGGMAAIGVTAGALDQMSQAKKQRDSGQISQSQYRRLQVDNGMKTAEQLIKLKKYNPATAVMNDVIGTDPISLGFEAVGDIVHGTDNAKQSLKGMGKAWDKSLTKQAFTDPRAAGQRVEQGLKKTGKNIEQGAKTASRKIKQGTRKMSQGVKKGAKNVGKAIGGLFKKKKKRKK